MSSIRSLLNAKNWIPFFKPIANYFNDNDTAIFFSELVNRHGYYEETGQLEDGWFFATIDTIEHAVNMSKHKQSKVISNLKNENLILVKYKGSPPKRYFKFHENLEIQIAKILTFKKPPIQRLKNSPFKEQKIGPSKGEKSDTSNTISIITKDDNIIAQQQQDFKVEVFDSEQDYLNSIDAKRKKVALKKEIYAPEHPDGIIGGLDDQPEIEESYQSTDEVVNAIAGAYISRDTPENRMKAWKIISLYLDSESFKDQWNFICDRLPFADPIETMKIWVQKAVWIDVKKMKINKLNGWAKRNHEDNKKNKKTTSSSSAEIMEEIKTEDFKQRGSLDINI